MLSLTKSHAHKSQLSRARIVLRYSRPMADAVLARQGLAKPGYLKTRFLRLGAGSNDPVPGHCARRVPRAPSSAPSATPSAR